MTGTLAPAAPVAPRHLTWQKLILGDWSRWVRDPLDVARIVFACATIAWLLAGKPATQVLGVRALTNRVWARGQAAHAGPRRDDRLDGRPRRGTPALLRLQPDRRHAP